MGKYEINQNSDFSEESGENLHCSFHPVEGYQGTILIEPRGIINTYNVVHFKERLNLLIKHGYTNLIFDMKNIEYISAVGVGLFIQILSSIRKEGGDIVLAGLQNSVLDVFNLLGFSGFFTIRTNIESAMEVLCSGLE